MVDDGLLKPALSGLGRGWLPVSSVQYPVSSIQCPVSSVLLRQPLRLSSLLSVSLETVELRRLLLLAEETLGLVAPGGNNVSLFFHEAEHSLPAIMNV